MPRGQTFDPAKRARMKALHAQGLSLNKIAAELKISPATICKYAKLDGLSFDRSATETAVKARQVDLAAARQELAGKMMDAANTVMDGFNSPYTMFNFGGSDNTFTEHTFDTEVARKSWTVF